MYSRTQNENGTFNTRCLDCFLTIASCVETEHDLNAIESCHICPEKVLHQLLESERAAHAHDADTHPSHN